MKIVHVVYSLEMGGAEMLVAQLCRIQRSQGHDVSVCAYSMLGAVGEMLREEGFTIHVAGEAHPALTAWRYFRVFRRMRPDVVHCHNPAPTLQAAVSARLAGVRSVGTTRHSLVAPPYDLSAERKFNVATYGCDWIAGICEVTCDNLRGVPGAHRRKIVRVYNGAAAMVRENTEGLRRSGFTLLFVGRLAAVKSLGTLVRAVALARRQLPDLAFWIVGDGPERAPLEALAAELGVADCVRFWGQRLDTAKFFSAADGFAMSSVSEGLPMSLVQAMSLGMPAIVTDVGGMAEVVRHSGAGLLAPVGDAAALADAIVQMVTDSGFCAEAGTKARAAYEREFTLEQMAAGYMRLYEGRGAAGLR